jgi:hypothetical protein
LKWGVPKFRGANQFALNPQTQNQRRRFQWVLLLAFLLTLPLLNPWVRGDGVGYYAYARAPMVEHSLDFTHDYEFANESFREPCFDENGQIRSACRTRTGHLENHFSVGPAMLWSPFLLATHLGVLLARGLGANVAANGFSLPYRYAMAFATGLYGFLGLWLSFQLARKYVAPVWALMATLGVWWGSSLPVYMYFNPSWSHAHSAFACALFLWYWETTRESRSLGQWVVLGLITGLMLDVYYANVMIVVVVAVEAAWKYADILRSGSGLPSRLLQLLGRHVLFGLIVCVAMMPTFVSRTIVYGAPLESGYVSIRDYLWRSPVFFSVLFSSDHGLIAWTPLLAFAIAGLFLFAVRLPKIGVPLVAALVTFYCFISFYPDWAGISSYGNRFFISLTPMFILGLAYFMERVAMLFAAQRTAVAVCSAVLTVFLLWNMGMIYQWGLHLVPTRGPISFREAAYNQFCVVPGRLSTSLKTYFLRRNDLMRQIEKKDMEELDQSARPEISR